VSHDVLFAARDANDVVTLTLDDATGLVVGEHVHVYNVGNQVDGHHTLTGVDLGENQVTFTDNGATFAEVAVTGILVAQVTWIDLEDLELFIGTLSDADDIAYGEECVNAANDWAYGRRRAAGYKDNPTVTPSARVKQGTVLYAGALFREKGSPGDQFQAFQGAPITPLVGGMGQIMRLLGIGRPQVA
jgi:hypothetical protein